MPIIGTRFITINDNDLRKFREVFSSDKIFTPSLIYGTLRKTSQEIIKSINSGFLKQKSPDNKSWAKNPTWWTRVKAHSKANIGIPPSKSQTGDYQFSQSKKHLKDSLKFTMKLGTGGGGLSRESVIEYEPQAQKRAKYTHEGGLVTFKAKKKGTEYSYRVRVIKRAHMGLATWNRNPDYSFSDEEMVAEIWGNAVADAVENFINKLSSMGI